MSEGSGFRVGDVVELQRGTTYKSALLDEPGPVLLGLSSIEREGGFRRGKLRTYGGNSPEKLLVSPGEIFVSLKDVTQFGYLLGSVARVPDDVGVGRLTQDTVRLDIKDPTLTPDYLYWSLRTPSYRSYCRARATGTTNLGLSRSDFLAYEIPELTPSREAVLKALTLLESRIENNRKVAESLEEIAMAVFRTRLIDFVNQGETDTMPEGWTWKSLDEIADFVNGGAFTKGATGTGRMVIRIADLRTGPSGSTVYSDIEVPEEKTAYPGDVLFAWSGSLDVYRWFREEAIVNQHIFKVVPRSVPAWFVFWSLRNVMPEFQAIAADKATTMGHIKRGDLHDRQIACPPEVELAEYSKTFEPLYERAHAARRESQTLVEIRDTLLPRLISGEIRVPEAEEMIEEAA